MGENSKIEWTTHTMNPWHGCSRVSEGCRFCYAEAMSHRNPKVLGIWGDGGTRVVASEAKWKEPLKWDRRAKEAGERHRVFCASIADVFEDRPELVEPRARLLGLVTETPNLDWLLLTKRPQNALRMMVDAGLYTDENPTLPCPQKNLWIGTSVEDQKSADERIPHLLRVPAVVRFLSMEPLLGPVDLRMLNCGPGREHWMDSLVGSRGTLHSWADMGDRRVSWVIVGGESGPKARPMHPDWAGSLRDQCVAAGVPFFFKQWGRFRPGGAPVGTRTEWVHASGLHYGTGEHIRGDKSAVESMSDVGKKESGRLLDGRTWDEFPEPIAAVGTRPADLPGQGLLFDEVK